MKVRAKFHCSAVTGGEHAIMPENTGRRTFTFNAVYDPDVPEDERYSKYTPSGQLTITVDNPAVNWEIGHSYYLDFTPVED